MSEPLVVYDTFKDQYRAAIQEDVQRLEARVQILGLPYCDIRDLVITAEAKLAARRAEGK